MSPLLSPTTVPKHPIRHLHERAQQDGKLLKFVCSVSNPRTESLSPMEEAEQKRHNGEVATDMTPEQAAKEAEQVSLHYKYCCTSTSHNVCAAKARLRISHAVHSVADNALFHISLQQDFHWRMPSYIHVALHVKCSHTAGA